MQPLVGGLHGGLETEQCSVAGSAVVDGSQFASEFACAGLGNFLPEGRVEEALVARCCCGICFLDIRCVTTHSLDSFPVVVPEWRENDQGLDYRILHFRITGLFGHAHQRVSRFFRADEPELHHGECRRFHVVFIGDNAR